MNKWNKQHQQLKQTITYEYKIQAKQSRDPFSHQNILSHNPEVGNENI